MEDWGQKEVWTGKWMLRGWKIGLWTSKMTIGTSKLEPKWLPGGQNRSLEAPGTSKIGSWTVWKAVWRPRGSSGRPSWGSKGRFGRHLGATWAPREAFWGRFWRIWGSQTGPERRFFGSKVEKCKLAKSFVFQCVFDDFGGSGAREIDQNGFEWLSKSVRDGSWAHNSILEAKNAVLGAILASQNLPKWNYGGLQGRRRSLGLARDNGDPSNFFRFRLPKID